MYTSNPMVRWLIFMFLGALASANSHAQSFRTYLSVNGNDANPCTLAAPCRLLPAALAKVATGGEIWLLDSANYNTASVFIDRSVTILAVPGAVGSVVAFLNGNAINIFGTSTKVALRNLVIVPFTGATAADGISMKSTGGILTLEDCLIANMPGTGIFVVNASVMIQNSTIRGNDPGLLVDGGSATVVRSTFSRNSLAQVLVRGNSTTTTTTDISESTLDGGSRGLVAFTQGPAPVKVSIRNSQIVNQSSFGVDLNAISGQGFLTLSDSTLSNNGTGIRATNSNAKIWLSGNTISGNNNGVVNTGGVMESAGNNAIRNNNLDISGTLTNAGRF